ncbi:hypothetical protein HNV11_06675 [Spirosoma taeanense]|uniref:Uncharacterized protein n=1 Tax=Spirosoma taeanense TaxID=2735870 RepID=A0A6M5Y5L8_9BACT|nr:hypothetical protein [Spirosoma taeanense]QJW89095.1 hypothetical protein HNV11_06675 [Spirosoma taeanense]
MKTAKLVLICLMISAGLWDCRDSNNPTPQSNEMDYQIYKAIVDMDCINPPARQNNLLLVDYHTTKPLVDDWAVILRRGKSDSVTTDPAWQQFVGKIDSTQFTVHPLSEPIPTDCHQLRMLTQEQSEYYFGPRSTRSLQDIKNDFPNFDAVLYFSSVVYSADQTKAVCYRSRVCGGLCGTGDLFLLKRYPTGWRVVNMVMLWIA